jgi:MFS family permease
VASALLVMSVALPSPKPRKPRGIYDRTTRGLRIYLNTPRLRGLLALSWSAAALSAMVIVNTVVIVKSELGQPDSAVAIALMGFGGGSMIAALALPRLLARFEDRKVMMVGATFAAMSMILAAAVSALALLSLPLLAVFWALVGIGYSAALTPSGRLLTRSAQPEDRPAVFAAQFTLSHGCWLILYPLAGALMTGFGSATTLFWMSLLAVLGLVTALVIWPQHDDQPLVHDHPDLPADHPHLAGDGSHTHPIVIDDLHPRYPRKP